MCRTTMTDFVEIGSREDKQSGSREDMQFSSDVTFLISLDA